jgi:hypothetical protein
MVKEVDVLQVRYQMVPCSARLSFAMQRGTI